MVNRSLSTSTRRYRYSPGPHRFVVNPGMGEVRSLGDHEQIIATEAIRLFPAVVRLVDTAETDVVARSVVRLVLPDGGLDPSQANLVSRSGGISGVVVSCWAPRAIRSYKLRRRREDLHDQTALNPPGPSVAVDGSFSTARSSETELESTQPSFPAQVIAYARPRSGFHLRAGDVQRDEGQ
jgi:hypothetical protein